MGARHWSPGGNSHNCRLQAMPILIHSTLIIMVATPKAFSAVGGNTKISAALVSCPALTPLPPILTLIAAVMLFLAMALAEISE